MFIFALFYILLTWRMQTSFKWRRRHESSDGLDIMWICLYGLHCRVDELCGRWRYAAAIEGHHILCGRRKKNTIAIIVSLEFILLAGGDKVKASVMLRYVDSHMDLDISRVKGEMGLCGWVVELYRIFAERE